MRKSVLASTGLLQYLQTCSLKPKKKKPTYTVKFGFSKVDDFLLLKMVFLVDYIMCRVYPLPTAHFPHPIPLLNTLPSASN